MATDNLIKQLSCSWGVTGDLNTQGILYALAVQGPLSRDVLEAATGTSWGDLAYFGRRAAHVGRIPVDVSRTGYTGDLGYEVWVESPHAAELWDAVVRAGGAYGVRPAGMLALDVARIEAGLILIEVDFDSVRRALIPEQSFSPFELGILGRFVDFSKHADFVGRRALERERTGKMLGGVGEGCF